MLIQGLRAYVCGMDKSNVESENLRCILIALSYSPQVTDFFLIQHTISSRSCLTTASVWWSSVSSFMVYFASSNVKLCAHQPSVEICSLTGCQENGDVTIKFPRSTLPCWWLAVPQKIPIILRLGRQTHLKYKRLYLDLASRPTWSTRHYT